MVEKLEIKYRCSIYLYTSMRLFQAHRMNNGPVAAVKSLDGIC
jgi:hypothetical protein